VISGYDPFGRLEYWPPDAGIIELMAIGDDLVVDYHYEDMTERVVCIGAVGRFGRSGLCSVDLILGKCGAGFPWKRCARDEVVPGCEVRLIDGDPEGLGVSFSIISGNSAGMVRGMGAVEDAVDYCLWIADYDRDGLLMRKVKRVGDDMLVYCGRRSLEYEFLVSDFFSDTGWHRVKERFVQLTIRGGSPECFVSGEREHGIDTDDDDYSSSDSEMGEDFACEGDG